MNIVSTAFFRHSASAYESERCGVARGVFFVNFLQVLVRAHWLFFRGWELVIHHDDRAQEFPYFAALRKMADIGLLRLIDCGKAETLCGSMLWRMRPVWESGAEVVACRDLDSFPMPRDRHMLGDFVDSSCALHAILDSESHSGPLMGGTSAFRTDAVRREFPTPPALGNHIDFNRHGADQLWLNQHFWPRFQGRVLIHQRRKDICYPEALTREVAGATCDADRLVRHVGGAYFVDKALTLLETFQWPERETVEKAERDAGVRT